MTLSTLAKSFDSCCKSKRYALAGLVILGWEDAKYYVKAAEEISAQLSCKLDQIAAKTLL